MALVLALASSGIDCGQHERRLISDLLNEYVKEERPVLNSTTDVVQVSAKPRLVQRVLA